MGPKEGRLGWTSVLACVSGADQRNMSGADQRNMSSFRREVDGFPSDDSHYSLLGRLTSSISKECVWYRGREIRISSAPIQLLTAVTV